MRGLSLRMAAGLAVLALLASGWIAWWARGASVRRLERRSEALRAELTSVNLARARLQRALDLQTAAVRRAERQARERERRLRQALEQLDRRRAALERESLARRREADELRARLAGLSELDACRTAWEWLASHAAPSGGADDAP